MRVYGRLVYTSGMFHGFMKTDDLRGWKGFPAVMRGLGFEPDGFESYEKYRSGSSLKLQPAFSAVEERRNTLYLLEHADRKTVGNYLLSAWRYYTRRACDVDRYDVDFLQRVLRILERKFEYKT